VNFFCEPSIRFRHPFRSSTGQNLIHVMAISRELLLVREASSFAKVISAVRSSTSVCLQGFAKTFGTRVAQIAAILVSVAITTHANRCDLGECRSMQHTQIVAMSLYATH
jgi:hypothetical protein